MRLYQQLILFMLAATVVPLASLGFSLLAHSERAMMAQIGTEQRLVAEGAAETASQKLLAAIDSVKRSAELFDWSTASPQEREGGLRLAYQQSTLVSAVLLVNSEARILAGPVYFTNGAYGHPRFDASGVKPLMRALPFSSLKGAEKGQAAFSAAYPQSRGRGAALGVAIKLSFGKMPLALFAELGLQKVAEDLQARVRAGIGQVQLIDDSGRVLASSDPTQSLFDSKAPLPISWVQRVNGSSAQSFSVENPEPLLVSVARVPGGLGLYTLVSLGESQALDPVRTMRRTVLEWLAVAVAVLLVAGAAFTHRIGRQLRRVVQGAESYAKGELGTRIPVGGVEELSQLSSTFNRMGEELEAARARLLRWNEDLRQKVEEATSELKAAQAQLVEAQKLAAVGTLGAGVAHEINNPLAGILGNTQLLLLERSERDPDFQTLQKIEQAAKRCKEITQSLLRFSQQREHAEFRPTDLNSVVRDAFTLTDDQIRSEGIQIDCRLAATPAMVLGDPGHLAQVILALLSNARTAMGRSPIKQLTVCTAEQNGRMSLQVIDTGKGIASQDLPRIFEPFFTTKDVWSNVGLGLSLAYRIVSEHRGKIEVESEPGKGSRFTVWLPPLGINAQSG